MGMVARVTAVLAFAALMQPAGSGAETRYVVPAGDSPAIGTAGAPVVIVEFVDYQ